MAVPYTFSTATGSLPLSQLDSNFSTAITIGNTAVVLGDSITTINNLTLANVAITSVSTAFPNGYLANSNVIVGTTTLTLGSTVTSINGLSLSNVTISSGNVTISNVTTTNVTATTANVTTANVGTLTVIGNATIGGNATVTGNVSMNVATITTANVTTTNTSSLVVTGNQTFVGTGNRITGDFSNATLASRVAFQTTTANSSTTITVIPSGTSTTTQLNLEGDAAVANGSLAQFTNVGGSDVRITSGNRGTGTYLPLTFYTGNSERVRIDTSGNVGIGTSSPSTYGKFVVSGGDGNTQFNVGTSGVLRVAGYNSVYSGASLESVNTAQSGYLPIAINGSYAVVATGGTERMRIDSSGNAYIETGLLWQYAPTPTTKAAAATLTAAELATDIITLTGTTYTITLPTGTALDTYYTGVPAVNIGYDFHIVNTASGIITIAVGASGMTSVGLLTVAATVSAHFRLRRTAANTYILYRLS